MQVLYSSVWLRHECMEQSIALLLHFEYRNLHALMHVVGDQKTAAAGLLSACLPVCCLPVCQLVVSTFQPPLLRCEHRFKSRNLCCLLLCLDLLES